MVFCVVNRSCGETRGSSCSRRRKASIFSLGQSERLAKVRWRVFLPSRQPSRRRMAGGELRIGTTAIYMRTLTNINPNLSREIYSYMRTQINENQVAVRAKPHIFKILTSNRASTVGWNFGLGLGGCPRACAWSKLLRRVHAPGGQGPGKQENHHEHDSVAITAEEGIRLRQQLGSATYQCHSGNHQEASQQVEAHHEAHTEDQHAEKNEPRQELLRKIHRTAPTSADDCQNANEEQESAKPSVFDFCRDEGGD